MPYLEVVVAAAEAAVGAGAARNKVRGGAGQYKVTGEANLRLKFSALTHLAFLVF